MNVKERKQKESMQKIVINSINLLYKFMGRASIFYFLFFILISFFGHIHPIRYWNINIDTNTYTHMCI